MKIFVIDPVCAQQLGHNLAALRYFISSIEATGRFEKVVGFCAEPLADIVRDEGIQPYFKFNYHNVIHVDPVQPIDRTNVQSDRDYVMRSCADFKRLFREFSVDAESVLFFPSVDYYSIMGSLEALQEYTPDEAPRLIFRMIGVLENAARLPEGGAENVTRILQAALEAGYRIEIVAETPAYASVLAAKLGIYVAVTPYPVIDDLVPIAPDDPVMIAALGSARHDKGFLRLKSIIRKVIDRAEGVPLQFVVQNLPHHQAHRFTSYIAGLSALPGLYLASEVVPQSELSDYLKRSRVIVTPYAQDVYELRGSAMLMEALSVGRPNVSEMNCGFSSQIAYYDCGTLCKSDDEYADAVLKYVRMDVEELNIRMSQARTRFAFDSDSIYARLWS